MASTPGQSTGDCTPVTGGVALPAHLIATLPRDDAAPDDDLGRQAYWLLKLHADTISLKYREADLASMDDDAKRQLIVDIQNALGVSPLNGETR